MKHFAEIAAAHRSVLQTPITDRERGLIEALRCIVVEVMAYPPQPPIDGESYLPPALVDAAQYALHRYGCHIAPVFEYVSPPSREQYLAHQRQCMLRAARQQAPVVSPEQTEREALDQAISGLVGLSAS